MHDADYCRAKSDDLLKQAAQASNLGESSKLIQEAMSWHFRATGSDQTEDAYFMTGDEDHPDQYAE